MPTIEAQIDFEVYCDRCGLGLCNQTTVRRGSEIRVEPCQNCLEQEYKQGHEDGEEYGRA